MTTTEGSDADIKRMETLISVLKQLITVMKELRTQYPEMSFSVPTVVVPPVASDHHAEANTIVKTGTHEESATEGHDAPTTLPATTPTVPKLVIEIEEHSGKTHAHVRYIDGKPEAMFFVDAPISNEDAVVTAISAQTGLGKEEVKNALKYTGM
jgi:predicted DsbA family dithiol-disulfide isomerase